jgi:hypothetical protein
MNLIIKDTPQMPGHTDIKLIFDALEGRQKEFNWLITEHESYCWPSGEDIFDEGIILLSGDELTDIVTHNNIRFVWGILSAFDKSVDIDINNLDVVPTFDGEWKYGGMDVQPQHHLAVAEIVCVDSSYTMFISKDEDLSNRLIGHYSDAQDLHQWNRELKNQIQIIKELLVEELVRRNKVLSDKDLMNLVRGTRIKAFNNSKRTTEDAEILSIAKRIISDEVTKL